VERYLARDHAVLLVKLGEKLVRGQASSSSRFSLLLYFLLKFRLKLFLIKWFRFKYGPLLSRCDMLTGYYPFLSRKGSYIYASPSVS
jgi:hypothetical protein